jgi:hypothetical protein
VASTPVTQTTLADHVEFSLPRSGTRDGERTAVIAYSAIAMGVLGALIYASVEGLNSWAHLVVLAGIVLATIGVMIAVDPLRRH